MGLVSPELGLFVWMILSGFTLILTLIALIDLLKGRFANNDKLVWAIVVIFVVLIGPILYFAIGRRQKIKA